MVSRREDRIRQRAYEIWEREGRPPGRESQHWQQAAEEIDREGDLDVQDEPQEPGAEAALAPPPGGVASSLQPGGTMPGGGPSRGRAGMGAPKASQGTTGTGAAGTKKQSGKNPGTAGAAGKGNPTTGGRE